MKCRFILPLAIAVGLLSACTSASSPPTSATPSDVVIINGTAVPRADVGGLATPSPLDAGGSTYTAPSGWTAEIPSGWHELPFQTSDGQATSAGVQISNTTLPAPTMRAGYPIQVNSKDLPDDGIALIIATDEDPNVQRPASLPDPPLDMSMFTYGSASAGAPTLDTLWFSGNGKPYLASVRTGPNVTHEDEAALRAIVTSVNFGGG